jgi:hypothetical protein
MVQKKNNYPETRKHFSHPHGTPTYRGTVEWGDQEARCILHLVAVMTLQMAVVLKCEYNNQPHVTTNPSLPYASIFNYRFVSPKKATPSPITYAKFRKPYFENISAVNSSTPFRSLFVKHG